MQVGSEAQWSSYLIISINIENLKNIILSSMNKAGCCTAIEFPIFLVLIFIATHNQAIFKGKFWSYIRLVHEETTLSCQNRFVGPWKPFIGSLSKQQIFHLNHNQTEKRNSKEKHNKQADRCSNVDRYRKWENPFPKHKQISFLLRRYQTDNDLDWQICHPDKSKLKSDQHDIEPGQIVLTYTVVDPSAVMIILIYASFTDWTVMLSWSHLTHTNHAKMIESCALSILRVAMRMSRPPLSF